MCFGIPDRETDRQTDGQTDGQMEKIGCGLGNLSVPPGSSLYLEELIGYPAYTGLISPSICLSICPSICLEYKKA
jgi:hypothetical protein